MNTNEADDDIYLPIRQTIRRVILPLVQAIYEEAPSDIISFCAQYFENMLQKREKEDGDLARPEDFKNEMNKCASVANESRNTEIVPSINIQGSFSEPLLTGDKHCGGRSLRETSSWDMPPSHSKVDGMQNPDRADIVSGIGDQLTLNVKASEDDVQIDAKSGDANFTSRDEKGLPESCRQQENEAADIITSDSTVEIVSPSAPPYEDNQNQRGTQSEFENSGEYTKELVAHSQILISTSNGEKLVVDSKTLPEVVLSSSKDCVSGQDIKTSNKTLSPNSSFGFIPHLKEYDSEKDTKGELDEYAANLNYIEKSSGELEEFTVKFSETFQNLAQKFNSAENNLNVEFQKAKEISDIIQGRCQRESIGEESNLICDFKINNESKGEVKTHETSYNDSCCFSSDKKTNILTMKGRKNNCKDECVESADEIEETVKDKENSDSAIGYNYDSVEVKEESNLSSLKNERNKISQDTELYDGQRNVSSYQNCNEDDENRMNNFPSRPVVDESWRKRWYEVHPCLDSVNRSFQQTAPRLLRTKRIFTSNRRNLAMHNIGEAGDVPSDGYHLPQSYSFHGLESSDRNNSSVVRKRASEINITPEENRKEENVPKTASNIYDRETKSDSILTKSMPCSGNKTNQAVNYLETKNHALNQLLETLGERNGDSKSRSACGSSEDTQMSHEQETLSEIIVVKESDQSMKDDLTLNKCTLSDSNKTACEYNDNLEEFRKNAKEKIELSSIKTASIFEANLTEEKIHKDSNSQDLNKEETCTENYVDAVEVQEKLYPESGETSSEVSCHSKECFEKDFPTTCFKNERNKMSAYQNIEGTENTAGLSSAIKRKTNTQQSVEHLKIEPGLNSACGDFTSSRINASNDVTSQQACRNDSLTSSQYSNPSGVGVQEITAEYVEEIMDRLMQQQSLNDNYEGLNFSSYSESESSNIESDFSETDDTSLNNEMGEL